MKFSLFAHMERIDPATPHAALYDDFIALCTLADEAGMHAIWTGEHHGMDFTIAPPKRIIRPQEPAQQTRVDRTVNLCRMHGATAGRQRVQRDKHFLILAFNRETQARSRDGQRASRLFQRFNRRFTNRQ